MRSASRVLIFAGVILAVMAPNAIASTGHCGNFSVARATGVSCGETRQLSNGYLFGKGHPAGSVPTDGSLIEGWSVLVLAFRASGWKGHDHFSADYH
jgi:hypothetical protein